MLRRYRRALRDVAPLLALAFFVYSVYYFIIWAGRTLEARCMENGHCERVNLRCPEKASRAICSSDKNFFLAVGTYEGSATRRRCRDFWPEKIPLDAFNHVNFASAIISPDTYEVLPAHDRDIDLYARLIRHLGYQNDTKVLITLRDQQKLNSTGLMSSIFSELAASPQTKQRKFLSSLISFMTTHGFNGINLDLDLDFDTQDEKQQPDYTNLSRFVANLNIALSKMAGPDELSISFPASEAYLRRFDLKALHRYVSYINLKPYDGGAARGSRPVANAGVNTAEITSILEHLNCQDVNPNRIVWGMPFRGHSYTMADGCRSTDCAILSPGLAGHCSQEAGVLLNSEIVGIMQANVVKPQRVGNGAAKYLSWDNQLVTYYDNETINLQVEFARRQYLAGLMVSTVSDDVHDASFTKQFADACRRPAWIQRSAMIADMLKDDRLLRMN
ncbi:glycoside hydrolase [Aspergillus steynii IBT 23096]|uniref:chitinase n=1 Tax=Aspergillus steynii IBT 23096 TaxID=1392250 RepID=A0A2I2GLI2_9EURO|nr:glycoside hydrolase [Aspergillus steynii IBT 23096]PLB53729.1 glycoside hydrolase [Aspergillus steynii IBT 23096]